MELQSTDGIHFYELNLNVTGLMANCVLRAYKIEDGEKVFVPEMDKTDLSGDVSQSGEDIQLASYKIMAALQEFINNKSY